MVPINFLHSGLISKETALLLAQSLLARKLTVASQQFNLSINSACKDLFCQIQQCRRVWKHPSQSCLYFHHGQSFQIVIAGVIPCTIDPICPIADWYTKAWPNSAKIDLGCRHRKVRIGSNKKSSVCATTAQHGFFDFHCATASKYCLAKRRWYFQLA